MSKIVLTLLEIAHSIEKKIKVIEEIQNQFPHTTLPNT